MSSGFSSFFGGWFGGAGRQQAEPDSFTGTGSSLQAIQISDGTGTVRQLAVPSAPPIFVGRREVPRLSQRRKKAEPLVPVPVFIPAIIGSGSTVQRSQRGVGSGKFGFVGLGQSVQFTQFSDGFGDMYDTEMESLLQLLVQVA